MPKVTNTRKQRAAELLERLERGPIMTFPGQETISVDEVKRSYRLWVQTWILPEVKDLIPELRKGQDQ